MQGCFGAAIGKAKQAAKTEIEKIKVWHYCVFYVFCMLVHVSSEIYLLIAIFAIGEQKSVLAKQCHMLFVTGDAKGQGCNNFGILHLKLPWSKFLMCR